MSGTTRVHALAVQALVEMPGAQTRVHTVAVQVMTKTPGAPTRVHALAIQVMRTVADAAVMPDGAEQAYAISSEWGSA